MRKRQLICLGICSAALILTGCGKKEGEPAAAATGAATTASATGAATAAPGSWTPEALEELAAPIALYPDVVLGHVLTASTNPQEVLDAGNWLIDHQDLSASKLDDEAAKLGLSTSTRALLQFPEALDMMCMQMDWTTELGQAFTADQGAVLDAVQRLRKQAKDVGNLETSAQLKVDTETQDGKEIVTVEPPSKDVVYVPKYDPEAVYAPPPANIPPPTTVNVSGAGTTTVTTTGGTTTTVAPATTTAATTTGHSTGSLITTGLLAFGVGMLVNEAFDDDDDWDNYGPNYYHGGMYYGGRPYYPPPSYAYRPPYGNGYHPAHNYNRPPNYQHGFNNNTIIVNNGGNNYWNRQGNGSTNVRTRKAQSPITAAKPNRPELNDLNRQASDRASQNRPGAAGRDASPAGARQSGYAGARPENKAARDRMVANSPPAGVARDLPTRPKTEYKGATQPPTGANRPASASRSSGANRPPGTRESPQQRPAGSADRGRDRSEAARPSADRPAAAQSRTGGPSRERPAAAPAPQAASQQADRTAFGSGGGGKQSGKSERQASQRGHASAGGGGGKARKPNR